MKKVKKTTQPQKMTASLLKLYQKKLLEMKRQLVENINLLESNSLKKAHREVTGDLSGYSVHPADMGSEVYEAEFTLDIVSSESDILYEIDEALERIKTKKFGRCEKCSLPIERKRLEVIPYTRLCFKCQEEEEKFARVR
jgi:DnaK suppressor protein